MIKKEKILFISNGANRNGSVILLLRLIEGLSRFNKYEFFFLVKGDGVLLSNFQRFGITIVLFSEKKVSKGFFHNCLLSLRNRLINAIKRRRALKISNKADVIFCNTLDSYSIISRFKLKEKKLITYVHEFELAANYFITETELRNCFMLSNCILTVSNSLLDYYKKRFPLVSNKIFTIDSIIPENQIGINMPTSNTKFRIILCGGIHLVKGFDLLPIIIYYLKKLTDIGEFKFIWVGGSKSCFEYSFLDRDLRLMGFSDYVEFVPVCDDPSIYFRSSDVYLLPSREDSFPLVVLEAASCGLPTICFRDAGGASEFVENDAGVIVDYLNPQGMAEAIFKLKTSVGLRLSLGQRAHEKAKRFMEKERIIDEFISYFDSPKE